jgi:hypothetical protein
MIIYLYIKTHNTTGLKYLGKTIKNPQVYKGSGTYWIPHIKKHGYNVTTEILKECSTIEELKYWSLYYSELWDIVGARDISGKKIWANLKPEEGDGWASGAYNLMSNPDIRKKHKDAINLPKTKTKHRDAMLALYQTPTYKLAREKVRVNLSDPTIYEFYHVTGLVEKCTRTSLIEKYNLPSGHISNMIHERHRIAKGWRVKD